MISNGLNPTLIATVDMGCIALLTAWGMGLYILNKWAVKREHRWNETGRREFHREELS